MRYPIPTTLLGILLLCGCFGGSGSGGSTQARPSEKSALYALVKEHYLWPDTLPQGVDPEAYATLPELFDDLIQTARDQDKDRGWSRLHRNAGPSGLQGYDPFADSDLGLGLGLLARDRRLLICEVLPGSSAARAGAVRGDEVLAAASSRAGLDDPAHTVIALSAAGLLPATLAPGGPGAVVHARLRKGATGAIENVAVAVAQHSLDLVPRATAPTVLDAGGGHRVGYLQLREFRIPAENLLRTAFGQFHGAGVTDLIVDLRYNGGGTMNTAQVFANLMHAGHRPGEVMIQYRSSAQNRAGDQTIRFSAEPHAMHPGKIAFIVSGKTFSASEALVNVLLPYYHGNVALVGERTGGKPVATARLPIPDSAWEMDLVKYRIHNASGLGDYFRGLPYLGFAGSTCQAEDDLRHAPGDPAEASTAAALRWIAHGTSAHGPIAPAAVSAAVQSAAPAQVFALSGKDPFRPGLF